MQFRKDRDVLLFLGMGLAAIALGVVLRTFLRLDAGMGFVISGAVLLLVGLRMATKPKDYFLHDERDMRINEKAGHHVFWMTLSLLSVMYLSKVTGLWNPDFMDAYSMVLFTGIYGYLILRWYLNKRGE